MDFYCNFGGFFKDTEKKPLLLVVYKILQRQLHPDRFSLKHQEEKDISEKWSALGKINYFIRYLVALPYAERLTDGFFRFLCAFYNPIDIY